MLTFGSLNGLGAFWVPANDIVLLEMRVTEYGICFGRMLAVRMMLEFMLSLF